MSLNNINHIDLKPETVGNERKVEMLNDILSNGTFLPKTVEYKDIDDDFKRWVSEDLKIVSDEGKAFPTMSLFSNQRFSEYSQSWSYTDTNNNLLLNFKTITRDNNPQYGKIQAGLWNIPGDRFYTMKKMKVLDDNGTESLLVLKMKQPVAIDFSYKISVFTNKYDKINEFNTMINKAFASRQCYIRPQGHYMPMTLEEISDESEYTIDDRQFYSQTYKIKVMAYIITEKDYRVDEVPLKHSLIITNKKKKPDVEIEETEKYYFDEIVLNIEFPKLKNCVSFTIDTDFVANEVKLENIINRYTIKRNDEVVSFVDGTLSFIENDKIEIIIKKKNPVNPAIFTLKGINPNNARNIEELKGILDYQDEFRDDKEHIAKLFSYVVLNNMLGSIKE